MPVSVECPECENRFKVKDELTGRKVRCPKCATVVTVAAEEEEDAPARKQPRDAESGASWRRDGGKEPRPRGKSRKREAAGGRGLLIGLVAGGVVLLLVAVGVVVLILNPPWGGKTNSDKGTQAAADKAKGNTDNPKGTTDTPKNTTDKAKGNTDNPKGSADNPKVTEENFDRVQNGMSREQVEEFLGPGERIPRTEIYKILQHATPAKVTTKTTVVKWKNGGDTILLEWTADGRLVWNSYVRDQGGGNPPKSRMLGFPKL